LPVIIAVVIGGVLLILVIGILAVWQYKEKRSLLRQRPESRLIDQSARGPNRLKTKYSETRCLTTFDVSGLSLNEFANTPQRAFRTLVALSERKNKTEVLRT
jgi:hypothetical protein